MRTFFGVLVLVCLAAVPAEAAPWLVVSDIHLNPYDRSSAPSARGKDSNWALWESALHAMRAADPNPPVVIAAGDFLAHKFPTLVRQNNGSSTQAAAEDVMRRIESSLASAFPHARIVVTMGNNDDPCGDYRPEHSGSYLDALSRIWHQPMSVGAHYVAPLAASDRAVVDDDVFWSAFAHVCGTDHGDAAQEQITWLRRTLDATSPSTRDVIVEHEPPGIDAWATLYAYRFLVIPYLHARDDAAYQQLTSANASRIAFVIAGHAHRADFRVLGGVPTIIAPSISPIFKNNPAFLMLDVDARGTLRDYAIIGYDPASATWKPIFDFDRLYNANVVDVASMRAAHDRIGNDPSVRSAWASALVAGSPVGGVSESNWRTAWCAQTEEGRAFDACARLERRLLVIPIVGGLLSLVVLLSIALIISRFVGKPRRDAV